VNALPSGYAGMGMTMPLQKEKFDSDQSLHTTESNPMMLRSGWVCCGAVYYGFHGNIYPTAMSLMKRCLKKYA